LVLIGATPEGKKELVGFQTGVRESAQSWRELLIDIKRRGLEIAPDLVSSEPGAGHTTADHTVVSLRRSRLRPRSLKRRG
jgi:putative transposase